LVDRAVDLQDKSGRVAVEIDDEALEDLLAAEVPSVQSIGA
jgi:hypothetical protein